MVKPSASQLVDFKLLASSCSSELLSNMVRLDGNVPEYAAVVVEILAEREASSCKIAVECSTVRS